MRLYRFLVILVLLGLLGGAGCRPPTDTATPVTLTVSAAADLTPAFLEMASAFEKATGHKVAFNFGSTGQLAQQIERGAPVDVFAAANISFIDDLEQQGLIIPTTKTVYAQGRLTLWTRADSRVSVERIADLLKPEVRRVAIANPDHAPYGMAAREALQTAGLWEVIQPKLVFGENIAQTLQYADTGNVEVALVALSLSTASQGRWTLIPAELHKPLYQAIAVIKGAKHEAVARQFVLFIASSEGRSIMQKYGFTLPNEATSR